MISLAQFLLNTKSEYNGHKSTEIRNMSLEDAIQICKDLEKIEPNKSFVVEVWTDGCFDIYEKDAWKSGEHHLGHKDRLILTVENL